MTVFPSGILVSAECDFTKLWDLSLADVDLTTEDLALALPQLDQLRTLDISGNRLPALPAELGLCTRLAWVDARSNGLRTLQPLNLPFTLKERGAVSLRRNPIAEQAAFDGQGLRDADVPENMFRWVGDAVRLSFHANKLSIVPEGVRHLALLERLDMSRNPMKGGEASIGAVAALARVHFINVSQCGWGALPSTWVDATPVTQVSCDSGGVTCHWPSLREVDLSGNNLASVEAGFARKFQGVEGEDFRVKVDLRGNRISVLEWFAIPDRAELCTVGACEPVGALPRLPDFVCSLAALRRLVLQGFLTAQFGCSFTRRQLRGTNTGFCLHCKQNKANMFFKQKRIV